MSRIHPFAIAIALASVSSMASAGSRIDFETVPGGTPTEGLAIADQYGGVHFSLEGGGTPVLAEVGTPLTAFNGPPNSSAADGVADALRNGSFFLTDDGLPPPTPPKNVIITFDTPQRRAGGDLLDVDGNESWAVEARNTGGLVLETRSFAAGDPGTGDGVASFFGFDHGSADIASLRIAFTGTGAGGAGIDNIAFSNAVPLPPAVWSGLGMFGAMLAGKKLRRRRA